MPGYFLNFSCFKCQNEITKDPKRFHSGERWSYTCRNNDMDGIMQQVCPKCSSRIILINQAVQFEICLQCAIEQFLQDNRSESVFLLAKSRECFFEFVIGLLLFERTLTIDIDLGVKLSERRLGAFIASYFFRFNEIINVNEMDYKLRNDIMHSGKYPKRDEVIKFGNNVLQLYYKVMNKIKEDVDNDILYKYISATKESKVNTYLKTFEGKEIQQQVCSDAIDFFFREIGNDVDFEKWCKIIDENNKGLFQHSINI